jgi:hypothetical protein
MMGQCLKEGKKMWGTIRKYGMDCLLAVFGVLSVAGDGLGYDINDKLRIGGVIAGAWQYQSISHAPGYDNLGRGALVVQPEISFTPTQEDEFFAKFGFGAGNGLMEEGRSPFVMVPWAADLEDDCKNINGRNRDYLLTAWYQHIFTLGNDHTLAVTGGIIDATDYMDENAYSNDEFTQFMNEALVNAPNAFLPSYDLGAAVEWELDRFSLKGVAMTIGSNGKEGRFDEPYNAYFIQAGYVADTFLGRGNYRFLLGMSSDAFPNPAGTQTKRRRCAIASFDQELGDVLGAWIRFAWQDDAAAINYRAIYSGGLDIRGSLWGRPADNIGIGYAHLNGGNQDVAHSHVLETYVRVAINPVFAITGDIQYMKDAVQAAENPDGWVFGMRATAEF